VNLQEGEAERLRAGLVGDRLFALLGVRPLLGRALAPGDAQPARDRVVVLSYGLWQRRFAGDPHVVGRALRLDGRPYTVVGVMPDGFNFPPSGVSFDLWRPLVVSPHEAANRGSHWLSVIGRLQPGVSAATAQAEMARIADRLVKAYPDDQEGRSARVVPLQEAVVGNWRPKLLIVAAAAALVLLIACANAASLLLARAVARRRELVVRAALGASGTRLARHHLIEALLLSLAGTVLGLAIGQPTARLLVNAAQGVLSKNWLPHLDYRLFAFLASACMATTLLTALAPVLHLRRHALSDELRAGGVRSGVDRRTRAMRSALVVAQVALSTVLLASTGLLVQSLTKLLAVDPGIATDRLVAMNLSQAGGEGPDSGTRAALVYHRILERVSALPGVKAAAWTSHLPLRDWGTNGNFSLEGIPDPPARADMPFAELRWVSPSYFATLGVPIVRGRNFAAAEDAPQPSGPAEPVAIANQVLVDRYFRGREPLGRHVLQLFDKPIRIVGVVRAFRSTTLDANPLPELYMPIGSFALPSVVLVVRSELPDSASVPMVRRAIHDVAPDQPAYAVTSIREVIGNSVADRRLVLSLLAAFATLALLLAAAGLYGLLAYLVAQGRREIGIRIALGAARRTVLGVVLGQGARMLGIGLAVGSVLAVAAARLLGSLLFGVRAGDPLTLLAVAATLTLVSLLALWLPAVRAMRTDPALVLREDA
jgi:predicted permease